MGIEEMKLISLMMMAIALLIAGANDLRSEPVMGLMKPNASGEPVIYVLAGPLAMGERFFVLSPDVDNKKIWCCALVASPTLQPDMDADFLSAPEELPGNGIHQSAYRATMPSASTFDPTELQIVVNASTVTVDVDRYTVTDDGGTYVIDSCIGAEGINVYLRTGRTHTVLKHFYGYFNYEVAGNCLESAPSQK